MSETCSNIFLHCVWATWNRLPLIDKKWEGCVYRCIESEARKIGCKVLAVGGIEDHIHLAVEIPPTLCASELMKQVKGVSSYMVGREGLSQNMFKWQEGYGVFSISPRHVGSVVLYVENQRTHHANGTAKCRFEETKSTYTDHVPKGQSAQRAP